MMYATTHGSLKVCHILTTLIIVLLSISCNIKINWRDGWNLVAMRELSQRPVMDRKEIPDEEEEVKHSKMKWCMTGKWDKIMTVLLLSRQGFPQCGSRSPQCALCQLALPPVSKK